MWGCAQKRRLFAHHKGSNAVHGIAHGPWLGLATSALGMVHEFCAQHLTLVMGRSVLAAGMAARMAGERSAVLTDARFRPGTGSGRESDGAESFVGLVDCCRRSTSAQAMAASKR